MSTDAEGSDHVNSDQLPEPLDQSQGTLHSRCYSRLSCCLHVLSFLNIASSYLSTFLLVQPGIPVIQSAYCS